MILTPTVFVIGAGASADYGFPIGTILLNEIVHLKEPSLQTFLDNTDFTQSAVEDFQKALAWSGAYSVDAFLENRPEFMNLGKALIALLLISREQPTKLINPPSNTSWMRYLVSRMAAPTFEDFGLNRVSFVTFNYDRNIEYYLCQALANTWGRTEAEAGAVLKTMPIIHLHGQLGNLPWQSDADVRDYDPAVNREALAVCVKAMKIVHEGIDDRRAQFEAAKAQMRDAERIYFLGVGFGRTNMDRLDVLNLPPGKAWASEMGNTDAEFAALSTIYNGHLELRRATDCYQLVSNFAIWG